MRGHIRLLKRVGRCCDKICTDKTRVICSADVDAPKPAGLPNAKGCRAKHHQARRRHTTEPSWCLSRPFLSTAILEKRLSCWPWTSAWWPGSRVCPEVV